MLGVPGWKKRYFEHKFPGMDEEGQVVGDGVRDGVRVGVGVRFGVEVRGRV